ncbi:MAG: PilZ domain-containing protein [Proteobacteria bacterium]|nr:PilZ domain-containing protein [Pseudomonadota bacterium]MBU1709927.1 PilZ domain-containing protein [Pseudomonadota bacterium]
MAADKTNFDEKRQFRRYDVDLGSFAIFRQDIKVMPGLIIDISMGGLAFIYYDGENWPQDPDELFHLFGYEFNVERVAMETVFDAVINDESNTFYQLLVQHGSEKRKIRRRGVRFGELTEKQKLGLEGLIKEFNEALENQKK